MMVPATYLQASQIALFVERGGLQTERVGDIVDCRSTLLLQRLFLFLGGWISAYGPLHISPHTQPTHRSRMRTDINVCSGLDDNHRAVDLEYDVIDCLPA